MNRRSFLHTASLSLGAAWLSGPAGLARFFDQNQYEMQMLRNGVGVFKEQGGTIAYLITKRGLAVVDSQFPDPAKNLIAELRKQSEKPFRLLLNTHHHADHTSGNIAFKGLAGQVVAHANSLKNQRAAAAKNGKEAEQLYPDTTFTTTWTKKVGPERLRAHYFGPAHTDGDAVIHFEHANIAHLGDLVFNRRYPFVDRSAGASVKNWIAVLDTVLAKFDSQTLFIFGHAFDPAKITGGKDDIRVFQDFLQKLLAYVEQEVRAGKTRDEVLKATAIPGVTEFQGQGIERGLGAAYDELTAG